MRITKVISGGQTGADQAGIISARDAGIPTGGTAPKTFLTETGPAPWLADLGVVEHTSVKYPPRTMSNVVNSDGTIRFANDFNSAGERLTRTACNLHGKPYWDVIVPDNPVYPLDEQRNLKLAQVLNWIVGYDIKVLNIAGNKESTCPGIATYVRMFLKDLYGLLEKIND